MESNGAERTYIENLEYISGIIGEKLAESMTIGKLYLNPELSIKATADSIGSNSKYISVYLNHKLHKTFLNYINEFRVVEACRILKRMAADRHSDMKTVASESGFNSLTSFNRYFKKLTGMTPKHFYQKEVALCVE